MLSVHFGVEYSEEYGYLNSNIKNLGNAATLRANLNELKVFEEEKFKEWCENSGLKFKKGSLKIHSRLGTNISEIAQKFQEKLEELDQWEASLN